MAQLRKKMEGKQQVNRTVVFVTFLTFEQRNFMIKNNKNSLFYKIKRALQFWKDSEYFKIKKGEETFENLVIELPP